MVTKKFEEGEMVVASADINLTRYPDGHGLPKEVMEAVLVKTSIRYTTRGKDGAWGSGPSVIPANSVGIVKGYENVFMLSPEYLEPAWYEGEKQTFEEFQKKPYRMVWDQKHYVKTGEGSHYRKQFLRKSEADRIIWANGQGWLNKKTHKSLIVMIDGKLVAMDSVRWLEKAENNKQRFVSATFVFHEEFLGPGAGPSQKEVNVRLKQYRQSSRKSNPVQIIYKNRDGTEIVQDLIKKGKK